VCVCVCVHLGPHTFYMSDDATCLFCSDVCVCVSVDAPFIVIELNEGQKGGMNRVTVCSHLSVCSYKSVSLHVYLCVHVHI